MRSFHPIIFSLFVVLVLASLVPNSVRGISGDGGGLRISTRNGFRTCTVLARGGERNDVPNIRRAFRECNHNAVVVFPQDQSYWISEKLHVTLRDVEIDWKGQWVFSKDTSYWRNESYHIEFQNHRAGFIISGHNIRIDGHGIGGINGNGDVWYDQDTGKSTEGRPMPFVLWNITNSGVHNFAIYQSQFWSLNIMNGTNLAFENITCSSQSSNAPSGSNWVQNADGFNTMDVNNVTLRNFSYRGGDDCISIKPRSYDVFIDKVLCEGGNGIAIGSLGQYLEDSSVENVTISNAKLVKSEWNMRWSVYIKTWMGMLIPRPDDYESAYQPRGGGWGKVHNLSFYNFELEGVDRGPYITQDNGANSTHGSGTSKMEISEVVFRNFTGSLRDGKTGRLGEVSCSKVKPCFDIFFEEMDLDARDGSCRWTKTDGVFGLPGC